VVAKRAKKYMPIKRMDNVLIVVDDLEAVKAFFIELGLTLEGETTVEGALYPGKMSSDLNHWQVSEKSGVASDFPPHSMTLRIWPAHNSRGGLSRCAFRPETKKPVNYFSKTFCFRLLKLG
jgi:hypothetical protein